MMCEWAGLKCIGGLFCFSFSGGQRLSFNFSRFRFKNDCALDGLLWLHVVGLGCVNGFV